MKNLWQNVEENRNKKRKIILILNRNRAFASHTAARARLTSSVIPVRLISWSAYMSRTRDVGVVADDDFAFDGLPRPLGHVRSDRPLSRGKIE